MTRIGWDIIASLGAGVMVWWSVRVLRRRHRRHRRILAALHAMSGHLLLEEQRMQSRPMPTLHGRYHSYSMAIDADDRATSWCWRVHTELHNVWDGRLFLQGDDRPGKMRELYGKDVMFTGDRLFDRQVIVAGSDRERMRLLFTPYLRARYQQLSETHFQIEMRQRAVYAEFVTGIAHPEARVATYLDLLAVTCAALDLLLQGPLNTATDTSLQD
ncbi:MAG: hypothetical protein HYV02_04790 [Deltaproteobacteria bacterium]|nr:hypothetical protein [Deltaproteobacteria bacterium]